MQPEDLSLFNRAVEQANSGNKSDAYQQIKQLSVKYPEDPNILLWLAFTSPDLAESEEAIAHLVLVDPSNQNLNPAKKWLQSEKAKTAPKAPPPPSFEVSPAPPTVSWPDPVSVSTVISPAAVKTPAPTLNSTPSQAAFMYNYNPSPTSESFPPNQMPHQVPPANYYYPAPAYMPQRVLSGGTVFGYFLLYFFGCLALVILVSVGATMLGPSYYSYYYGSNKTGAWVFPAVLVLVLATTIWATFDASQRRARFGPAVKDTGLATFIGCILVWIIIFPLYLARRRKNIAYFGS